MVVSAQDGLKGLQALSVSEWMGNIRGCQEGGYLRARPFLLVQCSHRTTSDWKGAWKHNLAVWPGRRGSFGEKPATSAVVQLVLSLGHEKTDNHRN